MIVNEHKIALPVNHLIWLMSIIQNARPVIVHNGQTQNMTNIAHLVSIIYFQKITDQLNSEQIKRSNHCYVVMDYWQSWNFGDSVHFNSIDDNVHYILHPLRAPSWLHVREVTIKTIRSDYVTMQCFLWQFLTGNWLQLCQHAEYWWQLPIWVPPQTVIHVNT